MARSVTKSGDVQGLPLIGRDNAKLGAVGEMFVDLASGTIEFIVVEVPRLLGHSGKYHPIPWEAVRYDSEAGAFRLEMDKDMFETAPSYDRDQLANPAYGWTEIAARFFAKPQP